MFLADVVQFNLINCSLTENMNNIVFYSVRDAYTSITKPNLIHDLKKPTIKKFLTSKISFSRVLMDKLAKFASR